jgi:hypothetical protein
MCRKHKFAWVLSGWECPCGKKKQPTVEELRAFAAGLRIGRSTDSDSVFAEKLSQADDAIWDREVGQL